ncbi:MAG: lipopolysaccharide assembly protein LapA domain-containing protein [Pseudomonadota bacterium]
MLGKIAKRLWTLLIILPLAIVLIALAVANRQMVQLSADPMSQDAPFMAMQVPLFVALFAALLVGIVVGGCAVWLSQGHYRKEARAKRAEADKLARERDVHKEQLSKLSGVRALPSPASSR